MHLSDTPHSTGVRVLFAGDYWPGSNTVYIARAFEHCGAVVRFHNLRQIRPYWKGNRAKVVKRLLHRVVIEPEWNSQLLELVDKFKPDMVYISQADLCWPETVREIKARGVPIMCFYHDVIWQRQDRRFDEAIADFDYVVTTRKWQESEFEAAGAKNVSTIRFGYEPLVHCPVTLSASALGKYGADTTFIGTQEKQRTNNLEDLVGSQFPYSFKLWGSWDRLSAGSPLSNYWQGRDVHEQEIPIIYAASKIALHWIAWEPESDNHALQKGDQHNSRTFQIAACGGALMLAQRTDEHLGFFTEDVEAVYFSDVVELRDKLAYWLDPQRDEARQAIAAAARARCLHEDYSYIPIVRNFLNYFSLPYEIPS